MPKESDRIIHAYLTAYMDLHGTEIEVFRVGSWYKIGSGIGSKYRLWEIEQMTRNLAGRIKANRQPPPRPEDPVN